MGRRNESIQCAARAQSVLDTIWDAVIGMFESDPYRCDAVIFVVVTMTVAILRLPEHTKHVLDSLSNATIQHS